MRSALLDTYAAVPGAETGDRLRRLRHRRRPLPRQPGEHNGIGDLLPVDLYIPGCPPHPYTALDGLLRLLGRI